VKKILLGLLSLAFAAVVPMGTAHASSSSSTSGSCSGNLGDWGYFYAYTYQYAYISDGTVDDEDHDFDFDGFLSGAENARLLRGSDGKWLLYRSGDLELAVPYVSGAGLYVRDAGGPAVDNWIKLCDY
jgi:hypothetical protein